MATVEASLPQFERFVVEQNHERALLAAIAILQAINGRYGRIDHVAVGHNDGSMVTRFILSDTPCRVFVLDPRSARYEPLSDVAMLDRIKTNTAIGYNVFATNSPFWEERIKSVPVTRH